MRIELATVPTEAAALNMAPLSVVVFDVLRATSTIAAAMEAGAASIRFFSDPAEAMQAGRQFPEGLLCGERGCVKIPGFHFGNSPRKLTPQAVRGRTILMATTNGTRAIQAARGAGKMFAGSLLNAAATAAAVYKAGRPVLLLCAGTDSKPAAEDFLGAGAVMAELIRLKGKSPMNMGDMALAALLAFSAARDQLPAVLEKTQGGKNLIAVRMKADIGFCARVNVMRKAVEIDPKAMVTR